MSDLLHRVAHLFRINKRVPMRAYGNVLWFCLGCGATEDFRTARCSEGDQMLDVLDRQIEEIMEGSDE